MDELKTVIKKSGLMALGLAVMTKEQAEKVAKMLLAKGKANEAHVKKLANKIYSEARSTQMKMKKDGKNAMENMQKKVNKIMGIEPKPKKKAPAKKKPAKK